MKEKKVIDELESVINKLKKEVERLTNRKKDKELSYYYSVGKNLLFLNKENFLEFSPYKIYQRIYEEMPQILPHIKDKKVIQKHLEIMYKLAHVKESLLTKASWDQWYEILKFKDVHRDKKLLYLILDYCQRGVSGIQLRSKIKELRKTGKT